MVLTWKSNTRWLLLEKSSLKSNLRKALFLLDSTIVNFPVKSCFTHKFPAIPTASSTNALVYRATARWWCHGYFLYLVKHRASHASVPCSFESQLWSSISDHKYSKKLWAILPCNVFISCSGFVSPSWCCYLWVKLCYTQCTFKMNAFGTAD